MNVPHTERLNSDAAGMSLSGIVIAPANAEVFDVKTA